MIKINWCIKGLYEVEAIEETPLQVTEAVEALNEALGWKDTRVEKEA